MYSQERTYTQPNQLSLLLKTPHVILLHTGVHAVMYTCRHTYTSNTTHIRGVRHAHCSSKLSIYTFTYIHIYIQTDMLALVENSPGIPPMVLDLSFPSSTHSVSLDYIYIYIYIYICIFPSSTHSVSLDYVCGYIYTYVHP